MIYEFNGMRPSIHESAFVHQTASVIGNVQIGKDVYIGPGAAIRGDWGRIVIEDGCNVQENCTIHMFPGTTVWLHESAHVGHGAIIHGAKLMRNCLIGMNAVVMDDAEVGEDSIVGALCFVPAEMKIPARKIVVGNPAKIIKDVSDDMIAWKTEGTKLYQSLPKESHETLKELGLEEVLSSNPISSTDPYNGQQQALFETWRKTK
ncbi:MAG: transferase hexapeptide repeat family protein [Flavobacteriales bacterium]|nr:transferase hexapeptide repeat family protein [Flavobacteriales bacterium]MCB9205264.1 transferase hexapeptide repeat family protein [Flavobacteriales bacterium]